MEDFLPYGVYSVHSPCSMFNGVKRRPEIDGEFLKQQVYYYYTIMYKDAVDMRGKVKRRYAKEMYGWLVWWSGAQHISRYVWMNLESYLPVERRIMIGILRELGYTEESLGF